MFSKFVKGLTAMFEDSCSRKEEVESIYLEKADAFLASTLQGLKAAA